MREFIYLDRDYLESYLAQSDNGIMEVLQFERGVAETSAKSEAKTDPTLTKTVSGGIPNVVEGQFEYTPETKSQMNLIADTEFGRELVSRKLHDNIFDHYHSKVSRAIKDPRLALNYNDLVSVTDNFKLLSLSELNQIGSIIQNYNEINNIGAKKTAKEKQKEKEESNNIQKGIRFIGMLEDILPSTDFISLGDLFIPFIPKYLRENSVMARYKYPKETTILGLYKGTLKEIHSLEYPGTLGQFIESNDEITNTVMKTLELNINAKIIIPIAWFSESPDLYAADVTEHASE